MSTASTTKSAATGGTTIIAIVGPTAVGKSDLAVALAKELNAEIINADSMQLYKGMDIGTAKLTEEERQGILHHMLDIWDVTTPASVADYQQQARTLLDTAQNSGSTMIVVGGSGLYVRALLDDMQFPGTDADVRARLEQELQELGTQAMYDKLKEVDPQAAQAILPGNARRIVRALEVIEITNGPFTASLPEATPVYEAIRIGLHLDRAELDRRIDARVQRMWEQGLVEEVKELDKQGIREGLTASKALGYAQILQAMDGQITMEAAKAETARATRKFARRQESWFKRDRHVRWISADDDPLSHALCLLNA